MIGPDRQSRGAGLEGRWISSFRKLLVELPRCRSYRGLTCGDKSRGRTVWSAARPRRRIRRCNFAGPSSPQRTRGVGRRALREVVFDM